MAAAPVKGIGMYCGGMPALLCFGDSPSPIVASASSLGVAETGRGDTLVDLDLCCAEATGAEAVLARTGADDLLSSAMSVE
jgi:hypothetical protein